MITIKVLPVSKFGAIRSIGVHMAPEDMRDIDDALEQADRDGFSTIYFYLADLQLIGYIRAAERFYVSAMQDVEEPLADLFGAAKGRGASIQAKYAFGEEQP